MGKCRHFLATLALLASASGCADQHTVTPEAPPLRLRTAVSPVQATIFDPITVTIHVDFAEGVVPDLPEPPTFPAGLELDEARVEGPTPEGDRTALAQVYTLHANEAGAYVFPAVTVGYALPDGAAAEAQSARLFLDIQTALAAGAQDLAALQDIHGPVPIPREPRSYWPLLAAIAVGAAVGAALLALLLKLRRSTEVQPIPQPPHKVALAALAQLERSGLLERGEVRDYLFGLSEVFCEYLEGRFAIPAIASTSEQLLPALAERPTLPRETTILVKRFVSDTDPVKYAKNPATQALATQWTSEIRRYVEMTAPESDMELAA